MAASRFDRPTYVNKIMNQATQPSECVQLPFVKNNNTDKQPPHFSKQKSVTERQLFKPFGKAVDVVQNKNITTYGEDVFIEYNPMVFLGKQGLVRADAYLKNVMQSYKKNQPVTEIIVLKSEFTATDVERDYSYLKNISDPPKQDKSTEHWDWWGDDNINDKINAQYTVCTGIVSPDQCNATGVTHNSGVPFCSQKGMGLEFSVSGNEYDQTNTINPVPKYKLSIAELIPEVLDKLQIANNLIRDIASLNPKTLESVKFRTLPTNTGVNASGGRFAPVRRNIENNADRLNNDRLNHADFDDNFSIRISNFSNPDDLTTYAIKDILYEYMGDIKFKVSIPRNKETNKNKDFAFINFISEADLHKAFELLSAQRIFMDSAIL
jgi:hypothetical protein